MRSEKVNESLDKSVKRQVKSEQMKIELITNVSHDLKTPLTSIIGYIDLLKKEICHRRHRIMSMLFPRSQSILKEMIQDLFEISKATSGNAELVLEKLDMVKLLQQTLGDMEDRISSSGRIIRTVLPEEPLYISGDGKRLYRVYQNLMENALKYSMEGTRIYVEGRVEEQKVITEIKILLPTRWILLQIRLLNDSREEMSTGQRKDMDWAWQLPKVFQRPVADILISLLTAICLKRLFPYPLYWEN